MTNKETLTNFVAWLTTRDKVVKAGSSETVYDIREALEEYCNLWPNVENADIVSSIDAIIAAIQSDDEKPPLFSIGKIAVGFLTDINRIANALEKIAENTEHNVSGLDEDYVRSTVHDEVLKENWRFNIGQAPTEKLVDIRFNNGQVIYKANPAHLSWALMPEGIGVRHWRPAQ